MIKHPVFVLSKLGVLAVFGHIVWLGWQHLGPDNPEVSVARQAVANQVIDSIAEDLRQGEKGSCSRSAVSSMAR